MLTLNIISPMRQNDTRYEEICNNIIQCETPLHLYVIPNVQHVTQGTSKPFRTNIKQTRRKGIRRYTL